MRDSKLTTSDIEMAIAKHFDCRANICVPNVWWGWRLDHEADLIIVTSSGIVTEIEIKVSASDIKADLRKRGHYSQRIHKFYYAVPDYLQYSKHLPLDAGLIVVDKELLCHIIKPPKLNHSAQKPTPEELNKLLRLGCMRIWNLKAVIKLQRNNKRGKLIEAEP